MGRIRTIKPSFTCSEDLSPLPAETHLFAAGLLCYADDEGYFSANPELTKAAIFPLRQCRTTVEEMFKQLSSVGFIRLGVAENGRRYGQVVKFAEHQRVNRPTASKIKLLEIQWNAPEHIIGANSNAHTPDSTLHSALERVWSYYLEKIGRNPKTYSFTPLRQHKGLARLRECLTKTNGDSERALQLLQLCVDKLAASDWHMGRNAQTNGKRYCDWESHLFKTYEQMERWWNQ